ncbi:hypothetical protein EVAR_38587_1 [Eumeta japonica]|uniref:Uncharacterized protein n=1 Tax=Eumeta variegata TaxID=151549 RepID=A0A4C1WUQ1_EUMVA|nr:hypothetical protein EVAR_38587_1 [Eumeta japonica]
MNNFLGKKKSDDHVELVEFMLWNLQELGCNMGLEIYFLHSHLERSPQDLGRRASLTVKVVELRGSLPPSYARPAARRGPPPTAADIRPAVHELPLPPKSAIRTKSKVIRLESPGKIESARFQTTGSVSQDNNIARRIRYDGPLRVTDAMFNSRILNSALCIVK